MIVKNISLNNFRNYENEKIEFSPNVNIIYGNNAQGKTNILEGIYLFSVGKSNRTVHDSELIKFGEKDAKLNLDFFSQGRENSAEFKIFSDKRKKIEINEIPVKKNSELVGKFNTVYFGPEYMSIVKEGPKNRRKNLDILISQLHKDFFYSLMQSKKIIEQKNALLKKDNPDKMMLSVLNENLIKNSLEIIKYRFEYIKKLEKYSKIYQYEISGGKEDLEIKYNSFIGYIEDFDDKKIKKRIEDKINSVLKREILYKESMAGCQRDDIEFFINGKDVKSFGSQGQQKTVVLVQKIAEVEIIKEEKGEYPVLLLDDITSELDIKRQRFLLSKLQNMQIIITCTDRRKFKNMEDTKFIRIDKGRQI